MDTVRWGILGVGDVTEHKSGPAFSLADRSALVAVMRRDGARAEDWARRHGVPRWYDDADALLADPEVDAVYVATPPDAHADLTVRAARAGKPVYVEKPMARTAAECAAMITACERAGVGLFVAYYRRALPRFVTVKRLIDSGRLGELRTVSVVGEGVPPADGGGWRTDPDRAGGGLFVDLGSHVLDLLDHLLGPVTGVDGVAVNRGGHYRAEDVVRVGLGFASGVEGVALWNFDSFRRRDSIEIVGTAAALRFSCFGEDPLELITADGIETIEARNPATVQLPLIQTVVDELTGRGTCPSTGRTAERTSRVIDTVLAEHRRSLSGQNPPGSV